MKSRRRFRNGTGTPSIYRKNKDPSFLLSKPKRYEAEESWPLILFLHGMGERGTDLNLIKHYGIPRTAADDQSFPFITVSPQCPGDSYWTEETDTLKELITQCILSLKVDPARVYVTGLSMGEQAHGSSRLRTQTFCGGSTRMRNKFSRKSRPPGRTAGLGIPWGQGWCSPCCLFHFHGTGNGTEWNGSQIDHLPGYRTWCMDGNLSKSNVIFLVFGEQEIDSRVYKMKRNGSCCNSKRFNRWRFQWLL